MKNFEDVIRKQIETRLLHGEAPARISEDVQAIYESLEEPVPDWVGLLLNKSRTDNLGLEILRTLELIAELWRIYEAGKITGQADIRVLTEIRFNQRELRDMLDLYNRPGQARDENIAEKIASILSNGR